MLTEIKKKTYYYDLKDQMSLFRFTKQLSSLILQNNQENNPIVILCIGTDRATGDALGPIIGYKLNKSYLKNIFIYGCLSNPVHAKNIESTVQKIYQKYQNPFIIAIDACLGKSNHIGMVNLGEGSLQPGSGVQKDLPAIGNIFITGIVNFSGFMDMLILQNTRLNIVMEMADFIAIGIKRSILQINSEIKMIN